jgi:hypothetical protein
MGKWAGWPGRIKSAGRARPAQPHADGLALTRDERRRFDEIARRIDQDAAAADVDEVPAPPSAAVVPVRLAAVGLFAVGGTGILTGLARGDTVVLTVVGIVPAAVAMLLIGLARARGPAPAPRDGLLIRRFWLWLVTCAENGCDRHAVHLGWCSEHARYDPGEYRDEYWGDQRPDPRQ